MLQRAPHKSSWLKKACAKAQQAQHEDARQAAVLFLGVLESENTGWEMLAEMTRSD